MSVYRMHQLIPDELSVRSVADDRVLRDVDVFGDCRAAC